MNHDEAVTALINEINAQCDAIYADYDDPEIGFEYDVVSDAIRLSDAPAAVKADVRRIML